MGGRETLEPDACAAAIEANRDQCPGLPIGLTTGLWIVGDSARRHAMAKSWTVLPDFCSVNVAEPGTEPLWDLPVNQATAAEAGLSSIADAPRQLAHHRKRRPGCVGGPAGLTNPSATLTKAEPDPYSGLSRWRHPTAAARRRHRVHSPHTNRPPRLAAADSPGDHRCGPG